MLSENGCDAIASRELTLAAAILLGCVTVMSAVKSSLVSAILLLLVG